MWLGYGVNKGPVWWWWCVCVCVCACVRACGNLVMCCRIGTNVYLAQNVLVVSRILRRVHIHGYTTEVGVIIIVSVLYNDRL